MAKLTRKIKSFIKTTFLFSLAWILTPFVITSYFCVQIANKIWLTCLSARYPHYEFSHSKKIRSLIDTARNPGIFHFLLQLNGPYDFTKIKEHYKNNIIERRNKSGELRFPKLRQKLVSSWGNYAWTRDSSGFDINNHIILNSATYRGRPITDSTIQDFISDIVTKYIPSDIPQWQVIVIPIAKAETGGSSSSSKGDTETKTLSSASTNIGDNYCILVRLHHLIIADEDDLHINEILMLNPDKPIKMYDNTMETPKLLDFIERPKHIPNLWTHIMMTASNRWNEFIYHYDRLESPDVDKKPQIKCISQLLSIIAITIITVCGDFLKGYKKTKNQLKYKLRYLINLYKREAFKRNLTYQAIYESIMFSINPINVTKNTIKYLWFLSVTLPVRMPALILKEIKALHDIVFKGHTDLGNTIVGFLAIYFPLIYCAGLELLQLIQEVIKTPRFLYEELFESPSKEGNILQVKSYCGRKVISYSKSIDMNTIHDKIINKNFDISETEYIYGCLGGALKRFLSDFKELPVPSILNATSRTITKPYFLEKYDKTAHIGGVVFMQLPIAEPNKQQMLEIQKIINRIHRKQIGIYLLSLGQSKFDILTSILPEIWIKIIINYFSISFPITITEIYGDSTKLETMWGQEVQNILFFRPPQSKTCLSLGIHRLGDKCQLSVMANSQLAPGQNVISNSWESYMETVEP